MGTGGLRVKWPWMAQQPDLQGWALVDRFFRHLVAASGTLGQKASALEKNSNSKLLAPPESVEMLLLESRLLPTVLEAWG